MLRFRLVATATRRYTPTQFQVDAVLTLFNGRREALGVAAGWQQHAEARRTVRRPCLTQLDRPLWLCMSCLLIVLLVLIRIVDSAVIGALASWQACLAVESVYFSPSRSNFLGCNPMLGAPLGVRNLPCVPPRRRRRRRAATLPLTHCPSFGCGER